MLLLFITYSICASLENSEKELNEINSFLRTGKVTADLINLRLAQCKVNALAVKNGTLTSQYFVGPVEVEKRPMKRGDEKSESLRPQEVYKKQCLEGNKVPQGFVQSAGLCSNRKAEPLNHFDDYQISDVDKTEDANPDVIKEREEKLIIWLEKASGDFFLEKNPQNTGGNLEEQLKQHETDFANNEKDQMRHTVLDVNTDHGCHGALPSSSTLNSDESLEAKIIHFKIPSVNPLKKFRGGLN